MKILHVSYSDIQGGAAIAALRLCTAQRRAGIDARMFVVLRKTNLPYISGVPKITFFYLRLISNVIKIVAGYFNKSTNPALHSINLLGCGLSRKINKSGCDIVHLHWINEEVLSIGEIARIKKPTVWTLHDSWAFCGAEHHPNGMEDRSFMEGYYPPRYKGFNLNRRVLKRKMRLWKHKKFHIVAPSRWETELAGKSLPFGHSKISTIPNCMDLNIFKPVDKNTVRYILNLDKDKKYILSGADDPADAIKGGDLLISALKIFAEKYGTDNVELLIFGAPYHVSYTGTGLPVRFLGRIHDEYMMSLSYNAADVMLVSSRMDNLPQTATESVSCGVPVVCFNVGGLTDIIDHKENGYIANRFDIEDFAKGINWTLNNAGRLGLSTKARQRALLNYNEKTCVDSYLKVYNEASDEQNTGKQ
jgi:glycosyltransferase involved in cell wall biosynthesis